MDRTSDFLISSSLGTVTVSTPSSMAALTWSTLAASGNRNRRRNLPRLRSTRCQVSVFSSSSLFRSPLIWRTRPSSTSTFTSSFLSPGRSALKTCASGVSFQSMWVPTKAETSLGNGMEGRGKERREDEEPKGKPSNGSQRSREKGSNNLICREPNPEPPGISDILDLSHEATMLGIMEENLSQTSEASR
ncbi:unnamed protein product [Musa textilis]